MQFYPIVGLYNIMLSNGCLKIETKLHLEHEQKDIIKRPPEGQSKNSINIQDCYNKVIPVLGDMSAQSE